ncbi:MAG: c-type cytochrome [Sterolibacterium sp.]
MTPINPHHARPLVSAVILTLAAAAAQSMGNTPIDDEDAVRARIQPVGRVEMAISSGGSSGAKTGEEIVKSICSTCHLAGVAGAPKIGDKAAWAPRLAQGLDGLVKSATAGKNAMPPKGGTALSVPELTSAIVFMANKSGASFKEPAGKK